LRGGKSGGGLGGGGVAEIQMGAASSNLNRFASSVPSHSSTHFRHQQELARLNMSSFNGNMKIGSELFHDESRLGSGKIHNDASSTRTTDAPSTVSIMLEN
jgi:hypothetical protein